MTRSIADARFGGVRATRALTAVTAAAAITAAGLASSGAVEAKAKSKTAAVPTVKRVSPMRVTVGRTITIRGTDFNSSRKRNTVIFKGAAGRLTLAKPSRASRTKLVVKVPAAVERILTKKASAGVPTRLSLRVVTNRYGKVSIRRHSPIVVSALKSGRTAAWNAFNPCAPDSGSRTCPPYEPL